MSRVVHIRDFTAVDHLIKNSHGYVAVVYVKDNDLPSQLFMNKCAEYSRVYPFIIFAIVHIKEGECPLVFRVPLSYVPTTAFFRSGRQYSQLVGTDWIGAERILDAMRADAPSLAPATKGPSTVYQPPPSANYIHWHIRKRVPAPCAAPSSFPFVRARTSGRATMDKK